MLLLVNSNEAVLREMEARACAYVNENGLAKCSSWSAIYTDGKRYGFLWSSQLTPAFDDDELGAVHDKDDAVTYGNVIEADGEGWAVVEPPVVSETP